MEYMEQLRVVHAELRETLRNKVEIATKMSDDFGVYAKEEYELIRQTLEIAQSHLTKLKIRLNNLVPINRLPVEVFTYIIHLTNTSVSYQHPYLLLSWVCHYWRLTLIQDPTFWTLVRRRCNHATHPFLDELFIRSQSAPLDIMLSEDSLKQLPMLNDVFIEESDRIRTLYLFSTTNSVVRLISSPGRNFSSLQGFYLAEHVNLNALSIFLPVLATFEHLESLQCFVGANTPMDQLAPVINRIRNLSLAAYPLEVIKSLDVLHNNARLQKLQFRLPRGNLGPPVSLHNFSGQANLSELQYLSIEAPMMKYFRAPKLSSLDATWCPSADVTTPDYPIFTEFNSSSIRFLYIRGTETNCPSTGHCIMGSKEPLECESLFLSETDIFEDDVLARARPRNCFHFKIGLEQSYRFTALKTVSLSLLPRLTSLIELHLLCRPCPTTFFEEIIPQAPSVETLIIEHPYCDQLTRLIGLLRNTSLCHRLKHLSYTDAVSAENVDKDTDLIGRKLTECLHLRQKASVHVLKYIFLGNFPPLPDTWHKELRGLGTEVVTEDIE